MCRRARAELNHWAHERGTRRGANKKNNDRWKVDAPRREAPLATRVSFGEFVILAAIVPQNLYQFHLSRKPETEEPPVVPCPVRLFAPSPVSRLLYHIITSARV